MQTEPATEADLIRQFQNVSSRTCEWRKENGIERKFLIFIINYGSHVVIRKLHCLSFSRERRDSNKNTDSSLEHGGSGGAFIFPLQSIWLAHLEAVWLSVLPNEVEMSKVNARGVLLGPLISRQHALALSFCRQWGMQWIFRAKTPQTLARAAGEKIRRPEQTSHYICHRASGAKIASRIHQNKDLEKVPKGQEAASFASRRRMQSAESTSPSAFSLEISWQRVAENLSAP